ncbi:beta-ketoacyl-ACP synthase III [Flavobacteriaceae bacterium TP-CH-4]|uniref:Beta-ketoacyl-ACP synthase III n=1 Tax=Pelagihabitans pacificus TaxID=2696054 RepID=A0A967EEP1_9FLAO|nr:beta-ketoacyl-ACP synthase III [Pelagihabitans pacificus]NHF60573.1 beta-ketoacyl-ACP synthase III [Pelagihabitans pacificus]
MKDVYITKIAKFLPNEPVDNDQMEERLGLLNGRPSRAKSIVLRSNQIKTRYYAIDKNGEITHNNAQLTEQAVRNLCNDQFTLNDIQLLSCGTSSPDQLLPSHAAMVHGLLKNGNLEINSASGVCCSGMNALKFGYLAVKSQQVDNAVCTGSERSSSRMGTNIFEEEIATLKQLEANPILAFEKDFLRWMLSDGAGAVLLENQPKGAVSLKIEWMEGYSYAFEMETCMYAGGEKLADGSLKPWSDYPADQWGKQSLFAVKQDVKLLDEFILQKAVDSLKQAYAKHGISPKEIDYYLPHISSNYFKQGFYDEMKNEGVEMPWDKWFLNLEKVGNIGAASIYVMLEELVDSGRLKKGDRILLFVPESARFSYTYAYLTVH